MQRLPLWIVPVLLGVCWPFFLPPAAPPARGAEQPAADLDPLPVGALARLGTTRFRHGNGASLAFASDGKTVLTFGGDRTIRHWDVVSGRQLREQRLPDGHTPVSVLSPDGQLLAVQDDLETFLLWDVARHQLRHKLPLGERWTHQAVFTPDGKTLVTAQHSGILKAWDVATGQSRFLGQHKRELNTMSFAADGTLVTVCMNRELCFWDLAQGQKRSQLTLPEQAYGVDVSPDGRTLAIRSWHNPERDKGVEFWDAAGKPAAGWKAPDVKQVDAVQFAPDGKTVLIVTKNGVLVWDPVAGKSLHTLPAVLARKLAFSPDGKTVAAFDGGWRGHPRGAVLFVWDLTTGAPHSANAAEHGHLHEVDSVAFAPDGRTLATTCRDDRTVRLWDTTTGRKIRSLSVANLTYHGLAFAPDGKHLFTGTASAILRWEVATGREDRRYLPYEAGKEERHWLGPLHLSDDGRTLLAVRQNLEHKGSQWSSLGWDAVTGKLLHSSPLPGDSSISYSRFSADGRSLALPRGSIHNAARGTELVRFSVEGKTLTKPVALSHDGALVAASILHITRPSENEQRAEFLGIQVWELATLSPVVRLETGEVAHCLFTPDGRGLITAGRDALTRWDLASGQAVARKPAHARMCGSFGPSFASCLALAPDGRTVATGHADTTVLLWDLAAPAAQRPAAPLTAEQQEALWADLAGTDGCRAFAASARLTDVPEQATRLLAERLRPIKALPAEELRRLIADLEAPQFERRETATARLAELGDAVDAALREALCQQPSPEMRRRLEGLLAEPHLVRAPEARRHLRAVRLLESVGTPAARAVLAALASGAPEPRTTREAKAALARLERRPDGGP